MAINVQQSDIREVRDQLFLDHADGAYLNVVTANIGLSRPSWGFSDDSWRAIAKVLGLSYKQITTKFADILSIIYGPQKTRTTGLTFPVVAGDKSLFIIDSTELPQIGTMVIDEGLATEEVVKYLLINRRTNEVHLDTALVYDHAVLTYNEEYSSSSLLERSPGDTFLVLGDSAGFPFTYPYPVLIGAGTANEEVVVVSNNNPVSGRLTTSALVNSHQKITDDPIYGELSLDYILNTYHVSLDSTAKFPESGIISLSTPPLYTAISGSTTTFVASAGTFRPTQNINKYIVFTGNVTGALAGVAALVTGNTDSTLTFAALGTPPAAGDTLYLINALVASAGTTTSVTVGLSTYQVDLEVGNEVVFIGNVTSALAGVTTNVVANDTVTLTFDSTITAPAAGDLFYFRPRVEYTRNSFSDNTLVLKQNIGAKVPAGTKVELLTTEETVSVAQVQVKGSVWDIIQSDPRHIEILIPDELTPPSTVLSASYIHQELGGTPGSSFLSSASAGDSRINVTSTTNLPVFGMININSGSEIVGYGKELVIDTFDIAGSSNPSTGAVISVQTGGLTVNALANAQVFIENISYSVVSNTASTITLSTSIREDIYDSLVDLITPISFYDPHWLTLGQGLASGYAMFTLFIVTEVPYSGDTLIDGNYTTVANTFPGPYIYDIGNNAPNNLPNQARLNQKLAGPITLVMDQISSKTALEVQDASFLDLTGYPYSLLLGADGGSRELVELSDIGLRNLTSTTLDQPTSIGDRYIEVTSLGSSSGSRFVNANGYRVIIAEGTPGAEIVYVTSVDGTTVPDRIYCEPVKQVHLAGVSVRLISDVLAVSPLEKDHTGYIPVVNRLSIFPSISSNQRLAAELIQRMYSEIAITDTTGLSRPGSVTINFGGNKTTVSKKLTSNASSGATTLTVSSSVSYPTTNYPYPIKIGVGTYTEEVAFVTNNNTGTGVLTISSALDYNHFSDDLVVYEVGNSEVVEYNSFENNTLSFSLPIMLESNHQIHEIVSGSANLYSIKSTGYDFPLRIPANFISRLEYLFDLLRAAGVKVSFISSR